MLSIYIPSLFLYKKLKIENEGAVIEHAGMLLEHIPLFFILYIKKNNQLKLMANSTFHPQIPTIW